jgi:hypothetical protein
MGDSLAANVWNALIDRERYIRLRDGQETANIVELERLADEKLLKLTEWLVDKAESL